MYLVGLHVDLINGISLRILDVIEVDIASCVVTVYHLHNTFLDKDLVIYGTEGGRLNHINQLNVTVLANQQWLRRNLAMRRYIVLEFEVCLVA
jgi:hypothetical protein